MVQLAEAAVPVSAQLPLKFPVLLVVRAKEPVGVQLGEPAGPHGAVDVSVTVTVQDEGVLTVTAPQVTFVEVERGFTVMLAAELVLPLCAVSVGR